MIVSQILLEYGRTAQGVDLQRSQYLLEFWQVLVILQVSP